MKSFALLFVLVALAGCSSSRVSCYDEFEKLKVDRLSGNAVSGKIFARTLVCLNVVREDRGLVALTNQTVTLVTNLVIVSATNLTVSTSGNQQIAAVTNRTVGPAPKEAPASTGESIQTATLPSDNFSSGVTTATARNEAIAQSPNQLTRSGSIQIVTTLNGQATVNVDSLAITTGTNEVITVETNYVVTTVTNQIINAVTNVTIATSPQPVADYFLCTEIAPADFPLVPGESLVVLADGVRFGCTPATPASAWESRRGFLTTHYKVSPEVIVALANAGEVKLRLKGNAGVLERTMSHGSRKNFREFVLKHFGPPAEFASTQP